MVVAAQAVHAILPITHMGARGDGIAGSLYIPGGVPGDAVQLDANGDIASIIPGPNRAIPACRHFGICGGCALQHINNTTYADWVSERLLAALSQHGIAPRLVHPPHISPAGSRRRASLKAMREGKHLRLGYNKQGTHDLVDLQHCPVLSESITDILTALRPLLVSLLKDRAAATIEITACDTGLDMIIRGLTNLDLDKRMHLVEFAQMPAHHIARLTVDAGDGYETFALNATPTLTFDGIQVAMPPASFAQATPDGEQAMIDAVKEAVGSSKTVADLFCGLGTFTLPLSAHAKIHAVDAALLPVQALQPSARLHRRPITTEHRDLFRRPLTPNELNMFDAVVFDPPRAGANDQCRAIATSTVQTVVAISCNPNTFARDAKTLVDGGYALEAIWPIGQFLWSLHVEVVALFTR